MYKYYIPYLRLEVNEETKNKSQKRPITLCSITSIRLLNFQDELNLDFDLNLNLRNYEKTLGNLIQSPYNFSYKVSEMIRDHKNSSTILKFSPLQVQKFNFEQIKSILSKGESIDYQRAIRNIERAIKIMNSKHQINFVPLQEEQCEMDEPFYKVTYSLSNQQARLLQLEINDKILEMVGINFEILLSHFSLNQNIPDFLARKNTVEVWNHLFEANLEMKQHFDVQIQTFEGPSYNCQIYSTYSFTQVENENGHQHYYYIKTWHFQLDDFLKKALYQKDRFEKNKSEYFNLPDSFNQKNQKQKFEELTYQRPIIKNLYPCGFKYRK